MVAELQTPLRAGISPALGMAHGAMRMLPARAGTLSHRAQQLTAIAVAWFLAAAWLNLAA